MPVVKSDRDINYFYSYGYPITPDWFELSDLIDQKNPERQAFVQQHKKLRSAAIIATVAVGALGCAAVVGGFAGLIVALKMAMPVIGVNAAQGILLTSLITTLFGSAVLCAYPPKSFQKIFGHFAKDAEREKLNRAEMHRLDAELAPFIQVFKQKHEKIAAIKSQLADTAKMAIAQKTADGQMVPTSIEAASIEAAVAAPIVAEAATPVRPVLAPVRGVVQPRVKITDGPIQA